MRVGPSLTGAPAPGSISGNESITGRVPSASHPPRRGAVSARAPEGTATAPADDRQATFRDVFSVREFRPLFGTFLLSTAGDELARLALTVLVYQRTSSSLLSALTFAIGHLPWLLGGPFLSAFADRLPRHRVLISADVVRCLLLVGMAIPGTPLLVLIALLFLVS